MVRPSGVGYKAKLMEMHRKNQLAAISRYNAIIAGGARPLRFMAAL
jgi:hypothetical protein